MDSPSDRSDTDRTGRNFSACHEDEIDDYRSTAESLLPVAEASAVRLRPGPAPTDLNIFSSKKISVLGVHHHVASVGVVIMKPDCFGFMFWDGEEECRINGERARRTVIHTQGTQDGFHATGGARRTMGVAVRRDDLIETVAALSGVGPEDILLERAALELTHNAMVRFRCDIDRALNNAIRQGRGKSPYPGNEDPGEGMFGALVDAYLNSPPALQREDRPHRPELIVRRAEERFFASPGEPASLADLCAATGVSQATLYRAFHAVCGEPPLAYFHKRRLTDARRLLINSPPHRGAVKRAALAAGLTEFGRFSVDYRHLFGESPSATLNRDIVI